MSCFDWPLIDCIETNAYCIIFRQQRISEIVFIGEKFQEHDSNKLIKGQDLVNDITLKLMKFRRTKSKINSS